jgi:hypothetical protein
MFLSAERPSQSGESFELADFINPTSLQAVGAGRFDSTQTLFFLRDLTDIYSRTFDVKYPNLIGRQLLPVYSGVDAGAEGFVWRQYDRTSVAKVIDSYAADLPEAEVSAREVQARCYSLGTSYVYSIQDLRKAKMAGIPLEARKAFAARRAMENAVEQIAFFGMQQIPGTLNGQAILGAPAALSTTDQLVMYGLTNFPGLTGTMSANNWTLGSTSVSTILNDVNTAQLAVVQGSNGVHTPDTLVLPISTWALLSAQARSVTFTDDSIIQFIQKQSPWIKNVYYTPMMETAGLKQDTVTPGPRVMLFERNEENAQLVVPQEFEQLPPQMVNLTFKIPCHMRVGGVRVSYPKAFTFLDGIAG